MQTPALRPIVPIGVLALPASLPLATMACAEEPDAVFAWSDTNAWTQIADWEDPANWADGRVPADAPGQRVSIHTPVIGKYHRLRSPVTLGELTVTGTNAAPGGVLGVEGGNARLRFDNAGRPALLDYRREGRDFIDVPVEFVGALVVTNGSALPPLRQWKADKSRSRPTSLFFGPNAFLCPVPGATPPAPDPDGDIATATFVMNRQLSPWTQSDILLHRTQNVLACPVEDAEEGSPRLRLVKDGPGALALASADNAYSGGTIVAAGTLCGVNGENFDPPFLPFGINPLVEVTGKDAAVRLYSSMPGVWGPGRGYDIRFHKGGTLLLANAFGWNREMPLAPPAFRIGSVAADMGALSIRLEGQATLVIPEDGSMRVGATGELHIRHAQTPPPGMFDVTLRGALEAAPPSGGGAGTAAPLRKTGNGWFRIEGATSLPGGLTIDDGLVCAAHGAALGAGPCHVASNTAPAIDAPDFRPAGAVAQQPGHDDQPRRDAPRRPTPPPSGGCPTASGSTSAPI